MDPPLGGEFVGGGDGLVNPSPDCVCIAQLFQQSGTAWADAPDRNTKFLANLLVGNWWISHQEQEKVTLCRRQFGQS
jgi:hypothetical protein